MNSVFCATAEGQYDLTSHGHGRLGQWQDHAGHECLLYDYVKMYLWAYLPAKDSTECLMD
jgi:hypothetical protein